MIIYALVARGSLILAEHSDYVGNFNALAKKILMHNHIPKQKKSFIRDDLKITFFSEDDFTFLCMNKVGVPQQWTSQFLDQLAELFFSNHGRYDMSQPMKEWRDMFSRKIKNLMEDYEENNVSISMDGEEELLNKGRGGKFGGQNGYDMAIKRLEGRSKNKKKFKSLEIMKNYIRKSDVDIKGERALQMCRNGVMVMGVIVIVGTLTYFFH